MELKDFIKDVISSIADAISEINGESTDGGIIVNPCKFSANGAKGTKTNDGRLIYDVEFNLHVSSSEKETMGGKAGISVIGAATGKESQTDNTSSIRFVIPVAYPFPKK